jgi:PGF-pre-PGF domain-containing protein
MAQNKSAGIGWYGRVLAVTVLGMVLLAAPVAAQYICWGKICSSSPLKNSGLCDICCSGHGSCIGYNNCLCDDGWVGEECRLYTRCGATCPWDCNGAGKGTCSPSTYNSTSGTCYCADGIGGACCDSYRQGTLNPSTLPFSSTTTGTTVAAPVLVIYTNPKSVNSMTTGTITISGAHAGDFALGAGTCTAGGSVAGSGTCTVDITFTPSAAGSRTATLTVTTTDPDHGDNTQTLTATLTGTGVAASTGGGGSDSGSGSSGGSSGSDGGGGGSDSNSGPSGSSGTTGTYDVNVGGNSAVSTVAVTGTGVSSTIITGIQQGSLPAGVPAPDPVVYQYIELTPARAGTITGASISFEVPVAWLEEHGLTTADIALSRYHDGAWTALPTTFTGVTGGIAYYSAQSPGFSLFAIAPMEGGAAAGPVTVCPAVQQLSCPVCPVQTAQVCPARTSGSGVLSSGAVVDAQTTAAGPALPDSGFPYTAVFLIVTGCVALGGAGVYVRRWWIRRQNPALFEEY